LIDTAIALDPTTTPPTAITATTVAPSADLVVVKIGPNYICKKQPAIYTITLTNNGPSNAANVVLTDILPARSKFEFTQVGGPSFILLSLSASSTPTVTASIATFAPGSTSIFQLVVYFSSKCSTSITNTASVSSTTSHTNATNGSSSVTTFIQSRR
jgi:hypothetical protein